MSQPDQTDMTKTAKDCVWADVRFINLLPVKDATQRSAHGVVQVKAPLAPLKLMTHEDMDRMGAVSGFGAMSCVLRARRP